MQTLHQELEPTMTRPGPDAHPALRGLMADQATAYAEEVRVLRQRVAALESELAATKVASATVTLTPTDFAGTPASDGDARLGASEFAAPTTPAVSAVTPPDSTAEQVVDSSPPPAAEATESVPDPGFAEAWTADKSPASFEERVAERAFFQATTVDEESRTWLLAQ